MNNKLTLSLIVLITISFSSIVSAHCEIPCGIYDDQARFKAIAEDLVTIEKSMNQINELSKDPTKNMNQLVRWVQNKEQHADHIRHIVTQYFMTQRLKPAKEGDVADQQQYIQKLTLLHHMLVYAMKAKQTTDVAHVVKLRSLLVGFEEAYFGKKNKAYYSDSHPASHNHPHANGQEHSHKATSTTEASVLAGNWELVGIDGKSNKSSDQRTFWTFSKEQILIKVQDQIFQGSYTISATHPNQMVLKWQNSPKNLQAIFQLTQNSLVIKLSKGTETFASHFEVEDGFELLQFQRKENRE